MPTKERVLDNLAFIANQGLIAAIAWHLLIATVFIALLLGWRPTKRSAALLLVVPLVSVSIAAATHGNSFNALVCGLSALTLLGLGAPLPSTRAARGSRVEVWAGAFGIAVGWCYPHFLTGHSAVVYTVAAPVGLLPCPTLFAVIGFSLLAGGFHSRAWSTALAALGLFYGVFGAFRLEVWLDLALVAFALVLLGGGWLPHRTLAANVEVSRAP